MSNEHKSALAIAIEAEGRHVRCVPLPSFFGPGDKPIHAVAIRVAIKGEEDAAIVAAHRYAHEAAKQAGDASEAARKDIDLLSDAKTIEALYKVLFEAEPDGQGGWKQKTKAAPSGSGVITYNAFPTPTWMRSGMGGKGGLTTDQIAYLLNCYLEVKAEASPSGKLDLSDDRLDAIISLCADHVTDDLPEVALAGFSRTHLTHAFVMLCRRVKDAEESVAEKERAVEALLQEREQVAGDDGEPTGAD